MSSFYSVFYIKSEPVSDEKVAVGLLLNVDNKPVFDYSKRKMKVAADLVGSEVAESIEKTLRNIKKKVDAVSEDKRQIEAFDINPFTESYFSYLSHYSNNLLIYSDPSGNKGEFRLSDFSALFRLYVDKSYGGEDKKTESFRSLVRRTIKSSVVKEKMDVFYRVSKESVKTIYRDHEVDYIGVNGSIISGHSVDMKGDPYNLESKFYLLRVLVDGLMDLAKERGMRDQGKHVVFYNEPEEEKNKDLLYDAEHDDTSPLIFKHWEEFGEEEEWIAGTNITKFSELVLPISDEK